MADLRLLESGKALALRSTVKKAQPEAAPRTCAREYQCGANGEMDQALDVTESGRKLLDSMTQTRLGAMHAASFSEDPKHLGFVLARYTFVAKMLTGAERVLEVGCGDGTGGRIVRSHVGYLYGIDVDQALIDCCPFPASAHDILDGHYGWNWDAAYALDVMEHIAPEDEATFLHNIAWGVKPSGTVIVGMPSLESQPFASRLSRSRHLNCKTEGGLREALRRHFSNVYLFGMNDATLHTGFGPMCHYRLAICTGAIDRC